MLNSSLRIGCHCAELALPQCYPIPRQLVRVGQRRLARFVRLGVALSQTGLAGKVGLVPQEFGGVQTGVHYHAAFILLAGQIDGAAIGFEMSYKTVSGYTDPHYDWLLSILPSGLSPGILAPQGYWDVLADTRHRAVSDAAAPLMGTIREGVQLHPIGTKFQVGVYWALLLVFWAIDNAINRI